MQRMAFQLRIREGKIADYDEAHKQVWPELLDELESFGVAEYSIFRRGQELCLYLLVPNIEELLRKLDASEINKRWQKRMEPIFEPVPSLEPGESLAMMKEVFYMPGKPVEGRLPHG
jgi:L-rhamnose mutarotase